jgi:hypothetical protein
MSYPNNDIDELITRGESIEHADGDAQSETAEPQSSSTVETRVVVRRVLSCDPCSCCYRMNYDRIRGRAASTSSGRRAVTLDIGARLGVVGNFTRARLHTHCLLYLSRPLLSRSLPILREYAV